MIKSCETCRYYHEDAKRVVTNFLEDRKSEAKQGEEKPDPRFCFRYPIRVQKEPDEFCGEWKKKERPLTPKQEAALRGQLPYGPNFRW